MFIDCHKNMRHKFVSVSQTVNAAFYVLKCLRDGACRVRINLSKERCWILHRDAQCALIVCEFLERNSITVLEYPPYLDASAMEEELDIAFIGGYFEGDHNDVCKRS